MLVAYSSQRKREEKERKLHIMTSGENEGKIRFINPSELSVPTGYSHVAEVRARRMVYISGQVALNQSGQLVGAGDLEAQAVQVFENLKGALAAVGAGFEHVFKLSYYLLDISQMPTVREVRNRYLPTGQFPASTAVEVRRLVQPEWLIEVEAVAYLPD
jgi:enamine deaminase RidA (YjgF/YER057c/UK114 family)